MKQSKILFIGTLILGVFFAFKGVSADFTIGIPHDLRTAVYSSTAAGTYTILSSTSTNRTILNIKIFTAGPTVEQVRAGSGAGATIIATNPSTGSNYVLTDINLALATTSQIQLVKTGTAATWVQINYVEYDITRDQGNLEYNQKQTFQEGVHTITSYGWADLIIYFLIILIPIFLIIGLRRRK